MSESMKQAYGLVRRPWGKLTPLGDPAPNAPKWFAAVEIIRLATDQDWRHKSTKKFAKYWRHKRERRQFSPVPQTVSPP